MTVARCRADAARTRQSTFASGREYFGGPQTPRAQAIRPAAFAVVRNQHGQVLHCWFSEPTLGVGNSRGVGSRSGRLPVLPWSVRSPKRHAPGYSATPGPRPKRTRQDTLRLARVRQVDEPGPETVVPDNMLPGPRSKLGTTRASQSPGRSRTGHHPGLRGTHGGARWRITFAARHATCTTGRRDRLGSDSRRISWVTMATSPIPNTR
ncbi:MAG: hypothetical protein QOI50_2438 [Pseudonocardiales bacterium]|nr:hypothetical protein [Pseudonocardiales bacterium]